MICHLTGKNVVGHSYMKIVRINTSVILKSANEFKKQNYSGIVQQQYFLHKHLTSINPHEYLFFLIYQKFTKICTYGHFINSNKLPHINITHYQISM